MHVVQGSAEAAQAALEGHAMWLEAGDVARAENAGAELSSGQRTWGDLLDDVRFSKCELNSNYAR